MDKIELHIFRFQAGVDYLPYYIKMYFPFTQEETLLDMFAFIRNEIDDYGCDASYLALRINDIAIFENLNIIDLVQRFGLEWRIEPLDSFYAYKDLLIDKKALFKRYEAFFAWADFLTIKEKEELTKYLMLNLITPLRDEAYLGDGFLLYFKWLMSRHPDKTESLLEWLIKQRGGILHFVPLSHSVYPSGNALDEEIWDFMRDIVFAYNTKQWRYLQTLEPKR